MYGSKALAEVLKMSSSVACWRSHVAAPTSTLELAAAPEALTVMGPVPATLDLAKVNACVHACVYRKRASATEMRLNRSTIDRQPH